MQALDETAALSLIAWLTREGLRGVDQSQLLAGLCERLVALGVPLSRATIASDVLHPTLDVQSYRWYPGGGVASEQYHRLARPTDQGEWLRSPFAYMLDRSEWSLRRRLEEGYRAGEFPLLDTLKGQGATDYLAFIFPVGESLRMGEAKGLGCSWTTDRCGGFSAEEIALFDRIMPALAVTSQAISIAGTARTLLRTYLGVDAADRVLRGNIVRGRAETIHAVIWYSDLAGFTRITDTTERDQVLALLNDYAECLVDTIDRHGGHVLKFMGDGILAIFPDEDRSHACAGALDAAIEAEERIAAANLARRARGEVTTDFYLALHIGDLLYGNFGGRERLDFTVLGPAVNEASRIVALCRSLEQRAIVSSAFAEAAGGRRARLVSLGRYALRGVARPQELFTIER